VDDNDVVGQTHGAHLIGDGIAGIGGQTHGFVGVHVAGIGMVGQTIGFCVVHGIGVIAGQMHGFGTKKYKHLNFLKVSISLHSCGGHDGQLRGGHVICVSVLFGW